MPDKNKIQKWIIIILTVLLGGTAIAGNHYKNKAVAAAIAENLSKAESKEAEYQAVIDKNNIDIAQLQKEKAVYKEDIEKIMIDLRKKAKVVDKLREEYAVLKNQAPEKKTILGEVKDASTEDISIKLNDMGYPNSITSD